MAENYKHLYEQTKKMLTMYQDELIPGFRKKIEELETGFKWIPVTERFPEKEGTYIVRTTTGAVTTARFYAERDMTNYRGDFIKRVPAKFHRNATHWMSLPEPPKEV